jgi:hypothetical protein
MVTWLEFLCQPSRKKPSLLQDRISRVPGLDIAIDRKRLISVRAFPNLMIAPARADKPATIVAQ